jgi:hypothetical protein
LALAQPEIFYGAPAHPYGTVVTDQSMKFGFIRIPKSASSTFTRFFSLRSTIPMQSAELEKLKLYGAIREPSARLLSSIPESLRRIALINSHTESQTPVVAEIWEHILKLPAQKDNMEKLGLAFLDLVEQVGPFDAHHEAMVRFLFSTRGTPAPNTHLFDLANASKASRIIAMRHQPGSVVKRLPWRNSRTNLTFTGPSERIIHFDPNHPVSRLLGSTTGNITHADLESVLRQLHGALRTSRAIRARLKKIVLDHYPEDLLLYEAVSNLRSGGSGFVTLEKAARGIDGACRRGEPDYRTTHPV